MSASKYNVVVSFTLVFAPYGRKRRDVTSAGARMGTKRLARRQKKSKKKKNSVDTAASTTTTADPDEEYQSCDMKVFVDYRIRVFKEFLLEKYNQVSSLNYFNRIGRKSKCVLVCI